MTWDTKHLDIGIKKVISEGLDSSAERFVHDMQNVDTDILPEEDACTSYPPIAAACNAWT